MSGHGHSRGDTHSHSRGAHGTHEHSPDEHGRGHEHGHHGHVHGTLDASITATGRGLWAIKWSFVGLLATTLIQIVIFYFSNSVALLADTIHNLGDACTAIPLGVAFVLRRREPSRRFTYGYGRVEDLAGMAVVLTILASAAWAGYESVNRFFHPKPVGYLWAVAAASAGGAPKPR